MTDFATWTHANLAQLAKEQQVYIDELRKERDELLGPNPVEQTMRKTLAAANDEIVRLNNQDCARLKLLRDLCAEFDLLSDMFCKQSVSNPAYRAAMEALK